MGNEKPQLEPYYVKFTLEIEKHMGFDKEDIEDHITEIMEISSENNFINTHGKWEIKTLSEREEFLKSQQITEIEDKALSNMIDTGFMTWNNIVGDFNSKEYDKYRKLKHNHK